MGHHYAMAHAASKLPLPALQKRESHSGISMVRLLNALTADESKMEQLLNQMTKMARKLLVASNIETFSLCATAKKSDEFEQFVSALPTPNATLDQFRHCDQIVFSNNCVCRFYTKFRKCKIPIHYVEGSV